jgi:hypothetical protein
MITIQKASGGVDGELGRGSAEEQALLRVTLA